MSEKLYSNCCGAESDGELDRSTDGVFGRCSRCKDGAVFLTMEQLQAEDEYFSNPDNDPESQMDKS